MATVPKLTAQPKIAQPVKVVVPTAKVAVPSPTAKVVVPTAKVVVPTTKVAVPTTKVAVPSPTTKVAVPTMIKVVTPTAQPKRTLLMTTAAPQASAESVLTATSRVWNGTPAQVQELLALRYPDGDAVVDIKRRDVCTEIVGMLESAGFADTIDFLRVCVKPKDVLWEQTSMDVGRAAVERELMIYFARETGIKGVAKCVNCGSNELVFAMRQLRSGDEPMDVFVRCVMCGKTWKQR